MGIQGVTRGYMGLLGVTGGYKGLQGVTGGDKGLNGVTKDYRKFFIMPILWVSETDVFVVQKGLLAI